MLNAGRLTVFGYWTEDPWSPESQKIQTYEVGEAIFASDCNLFIAQSVVLSPLPVLAGTNLRGGVAAK
jgi:hypothetical protein